MIVVFSFRERTRARIVRTGIVGFAYRQPIARIVGRSLPPFVAFISQLNLHSISTDIFVFAETKA